MQSDIMLAAHLSLSVAYFRDFSGVHSLILCLVSTLGPGAEPRLGCDWRWSDWTLPLALPGGGMMVASTHLITSSLCSTSNCFTTLSLS